MAIKQGCGAQDPFQNAQNPISKLAGLSSLYNSAMTFGDIPSTVDCNL